MGLLSGAVNSAISSAKSQAGTVLNKAVSSGAAKLFGSNLINNLVKISSGGNEYIQFPSDLLNRKDIGQYTYLSCKDTKFDWQGKSKKTVLGAVYLPLPKELNVDYKSNWSSADGGAGTLYIDSIKGISEAFKTGSLNAAINPMSETAGYMGAKKIAEAAGAVGAREALENQLGRVLNPMKLLNWQTPDFRSFSFTWDLVPTAGQEAEDLNQIIYWLKRYIHTPSAPSEITLQYPPLWDIHFVDSSAGSINDGIGNKFLFTTKECAITNISVDYTSKGNVFHRTGTDGKGHHAPNGIRLSIQFTETSILTQSDFGTAYPTNKPTP